MILPKFVDLLIEMYHICACFCHVEKRNSGIRHELRLTILKIRALNTEPSMSHTRTELGNLKNSNLMVWIVIKLFVI
jgi:hypothetical protein